MWLPSPDRGDTWLGHFPPSWIILTGILILIPGSGQSRPEKSFHMFCNYFNVLSDKSQRIQVRHVLGPGITSETILYTFIKIKCEAFLWNNTQFIILSPAPPKSDLDQSQFFWEFAILCSKKSHRGSHYFELITVGPSGWIQSPYLLIPTAITSRLDLKIALHAKYNLKLWRANAVLIITWAGMCN